MKVGLLLLHPLTESLGSVRRVIDIATGLKEKGIEPIIITPFSKTTEVNGIRVESIPSTFLKLGLEESIYRVARNFINNRLFIKIAIRTMRRRMMGDVALDYLKRLKLDILQIEQEPTAIVALSLRKGLSIPFVLDFHGIWADDLIDFGMINKRDEEYQMLQDMVRDAIQSMDAVLVISEEMKQYVLREYSADPQNTHVVGLGAKPRITEIPDRGGLMKVIYAGTFSKEKHVDLFLRSIPYVVERVGMIEFYITEKGDMLKEARRIRKEFGADVRSFWFDDENDLFGFMSKCHVGVLTLPDNLSYRINPAAKFFDYMSVGLPVVANDIGGWTKSIESDGVGILTQDDPRDFAKGLIRLAEDRNLALECSEKCLELVRTKYNLNNIIEKLLTIYDRLLR